MPMNEDSDDMTLEFRFQHPATAERIRVNSYNEAHKILVLHLLTKDQACEIVGRKHVNEIKPNSLIDQMAAGDFGPGAHVCAVIHMRVMSILTRAEMHFELCAQCGLI